MYETYLYLSFTIVLILIFLLSGFIALVLALLLGFLQKELFKLNPYAIASVILTLIVMTIAMIALRRQPQTSEKMSFKVILK